MSDDTTVTIAIKANIEAFKKSMQEAKKSVGSAGKAISQDADKMSDSMKEATGGKNGGFQAFADSFKGISPMFDSVTGSIKDMGDRLKSAGKAGKLALAGVKLAIAGLAAGLIVTLGKAIMETTGKFAAMADPVRFDKATSDMKESVRKLKTSIGQLASPVFEYMAKGVKLLADGLTWVVERLGMFVGFLQGLLGLGHKVNQTLAGTAEGMDEAGIAAGAGLASFDKLNSINVNELGDMDQAERLTKLMDDMRVKGAAMAKKIKEAVKPITDTLDKVKALFSMDPGEIWTKFSSAAVEAWEGVKSWAGNAWDNIKATAAGAWSGMAEWAGNAWDNVKAKAGNVWSGITDTVKTAWDTIKTYIVSKFTEAGEFLKGMFRGVVNVFKAAWDKVFGAINNAIKWIVDKIGWLNDKISGLREAASNIGKKVSGAVGGFVDGVKGVLGFARGGVFQPNSPQLVMVGDNKSEPEVIAPRSMIMDAMRQVINESGGSRGHTENITLTIDGKTLARYVYNDLVQEGIRSGRGTIA